MPSNQTTNYGLSQWVKSDQVLMEDFNADNAKIDGALAAHGLELAKLPFFGNCRIEHFSYVGTGKYGPNNPTVIPYSRRPLLVVVIGENYCMMDSPFIKHYVLMIGGVYQHPDTHYSVWGDDGLSFYSNSEPLGGTIYNNPLAQMNTKNQPYAAVILIAQDET